MKETEKRINDFVGGQIRSVRKKLGVTQQELGRELATYSLGPSNPMIAQIMS